MASPAASIVIRRAVGPIAGYRGFLSEQSAVGRAQLYSIAVSLCERFDPCVNRFLCHSLEGRAFSVSLHGRRACTIRGSGQRLHNCTVLLTPTPPLP